MIEALRNQLKNHDEKTTRKHKVGQENELEKKFEELETIIEEYQDSRANFERVDKRLINVQNSDDSLFLIHPELFFTRKCLKKINVLELIGKGKLGKVNYYF